MRTSGGAGRCRAAPPVLPGARVHGRVRAEADGAAIGTLVKDRAEADRAVVGAPVKERAEADRAATDAPVVERAEADRAATGAPVTERAEADRASKWCSHEGQSAKSATAQERQAQARPRYFQVKEQVGLTGSGAKIPQLPAQKPTAFVRCLCTWHRQTLVPTDRSVAIEQARSSGHARMQ